MSCRLGVVRSDVARGFVFGWREVEDKALVEREW